MLDVGAADQWLRSWLAPSVDYVALDYPATGRDLYGAHPDVFADAASMPFSSDSFDGACCFEVAEHVPAPLAVFLEIHRVLKPGGHAWISMPFLYPLHDEPFDFQRYTEFGLLRDVRGAGFEVVSLTKFGHAIRSAGLLMCLALSGAAYERRGMLRLALLPVAGLAVLCINLIAALGCRVWPDWKRMAMGYAVEVRKP